MSLYTTLCEWSGSAYSGNGNGKANANGHSSSSSSKPGYVYDEYSKSYVYATPLYSPVEEYGYDDPIVQPKTYPRSPYNPNDVGIVSRTRNETDTIVEIEKQSPPSFSYPGPVAGAGFLGLFAPGPGSPEYNAYVAKQNAKEGDFNPEHVGLPVLESNKRSTVNEVAKQVQGPTLWDRFSGAVYEGYTQAPKDVNVFEESIKAAGKAVTGIINPSNSPLLLIGGAVLLLLLILKR